MEAITPTETPVP